MLRFARGQADIISSELVRVVKTVSRPIPRRLPRGAFTFSSALTLAVITNVLIQQDRHAESDEKKKKFSDTLFLSSVEDWTKVPLLGCKSAVLSLITVSIFLTE